MSSSDGIARTGNDMRLPYEVTEEDISGLNAFEFADLMNRLLRAEVSRIGLSPIHVQTSLRVQDPDAGVDARVREVAHQSPWVPQGLSVWQFKSGKDHEPADLRKEFAKPLVQEALKQGGTYLVVIKEELGLVKQEHRETALRECCAGSDISSEKCRLLT